MNDDDRKRLDQIEEKVDRVLEIAERVQEAMTGFLDRIGSHPVLGRFMGGDGD